MNTLAGALLLASAEWQLDVAPATTCPTAAAVAGELTAIGTGGSGRVVIEEVGDHALRLTITSSAPGARPVTRTLRVPASCASRARAAAVVIASHDTELAGRPPESAQVRAQVRAHVVPTAPAGGLEIGGGAVALGNGRDAALAGVLELSAPAARTISAVGRVGAATTRDQPLAGGEARWARAFAALGVRETLLAGGGWRLHLRQEALALVTFARGDGFRRSYRRQAVGPGLGFAARVAHGQGPWRPWIEAGTMLALTPATLSAVDGTGARRAVDLPRWDATLAVGVTWSSR